VFRIILNAAAADNYGLSVLSCAFCMLCLWNGSNIYSHTENCPKWWARPGRMAWERLITVACCSIWTLYNWAVVNEKAWELRRQLIDTNCFKSPLPKALVSFIQNILIFHYFIFRNWLANYSSFGRTWRRGYQTLADHRKTGSWLQWYFLKCFPFWLYVTTLSENENWLVHLLCIKVPIQRNFTERFLDCIAKIISNDYVTSLVEFL
jgi:hypothetical protein